MNRPGHARQAAACLALAVWLVGCSLGTPPQSSNPTPAPSPTLAATHSPLPTPPGADLPPAGLVLWLPPQWDPAGEGEAARLLSDRLQAFTRRTGAPVSVRIKAASGPAGLFSSLAAASAAAPGALPAVIALPRDDYETAAVRGLLAPLDGLATSIDGQDWYAYLSEISVVQGSVYGLPFAGSCLGFVSRAGRGQPPAAWNDALRLGQTVVFAAGSPRAEVITALYLSAGGAVADPQRRPTLQVEPLAQVYTLMRQGADRGLFPIWLAGLTEEEAAWQAYIDRRADAAMAWSDDYLSGAGPGDEFTPIPGLGPDPAVLGTGWVFALTGATLEPRALPVQLAEWLAAPEFLGPWSEAAGFLPARPSALALWKNTPRRSLFDGLARAAHPLPSAELGQIVGTALTGGLVRVVKLEQDPQQAALEAAGRLEVPQQK